MSASTHPAPDAAGTITIEVDAATVVGLAMVHNDIRVVDELRILNSGPAVQGLEVTCILRDDEGELGRAEPNFVDTADSGTTHVDDVRLRLDPATVLELEERRRATLIVTATASGHQVARHTHDVLVLAGRQWLAQPPRLGLEMLAAHVMPNSPVIQEIVSEASDILGRETGSPAVQGYQAGPERADHIARAIYLAVCARGVRYANPPASWSDDGQKVRTPDEVLVDRIGTCLDTTVVLAAAFEQAGLHPLLWVVEGHSVVGHWRDEAARLDGIVTPEPGDLINALDLGLLRVVETTLVCAPEPAPFDRAVRRAADTVRSTRTLGVVDVIVARRGDVLPLPSRQRLPSGDVQVITYQAAEHSVPLPTVAQRPTPPAEPTPSSRPAPPPRVQQWKNALLDLTLRNRLLNFTPRHAVELTVPDGALPGLEDLVHDGTALRLLPSDVIDEVHRQRGVRYGRDLPDDHLRGQLAKNQLYADVTAAAYVNRLRRLAHNARTIEDETGANNLYLALGMLRWRIEEKETASPLILVPVRLHARGRGTRTTYTFTLDDAGGSTPNYCLLEKLQQTFGLRIPELAEPTEDVSGVDLQRTLDAVRLAVAGAGLPFHVDDTAHLAILQFAKFRLWKDLDEHWETLLENPLARHLTHTPTDAFEDPVPTPNAETTTLDALAAECPIPADGSQLHAVRAAVNGNTFVLEGPPGTGKSQTITNLLARCLAEGKRVLFVAEKRAALDVVRTRLDAVGLGCFSLDLHDKGSKPAAVRAQITEAMDHRAHPDADGNRVQHEQHRSSGRALARYAEQLHAANGAGLSLYAARSAILAGDSGITPLTVPPALLTDTSRSHREAVRDALLTLPEVAIPARPGSDHSWGFVTASGLGPDELQEGLAAVAGVEEALAAAPTRGPWAQALTTATTPDELAALAALAAPGSPTLPVLDETRTPRWQEATSRLTSDITTFADAAHPGLDRATPEAMNLPLAQIDAEAQAAAGSSWFGRKKRLAAVGERLRSVLRDGVGVPPKEVPALARALAEAQSALAALADRARSIPGVGVPDGWNPLLPEARDLVARRVAWLDWLGARVGADAVIAGATGTADTAHQALRDAVTQGQPLEVRERAALAGVHTHLSRVVSLLSSDDAVSAWAGDLGLVERWTTTRERRSTPHDARVSLGAWLSLRRHLAPLRAADMMEAESLLVTGATSAEDAVSAFDLGVAEASVSERLGAYALDVFDTDAHERSIRRFGQSGSALRDTLPEVLQAQILAARPFDPAVEAGQVGSLRRELTKQRGRLPVRALMRTYDDLITQLMPCVLVSPDSLARFFSPRAGQFDVVVFDEASQIRVADAIGAIGRASSVIVVGDSKQMPPTSFAEPSIAGDDEELPGGVSLIPDDEESILTEAVQARIERQWLSWHYRSQDESLISFSNHRYYEGRLSTFPAPSSGRPDSRADGHGVNLVRVDGVFLRDAKGKSHRTNPVEAEAIVTDIKARFDAQSARGVDVPPSVGVVTFNQQQREHIESLLRDDPDERLAAALDDTEHEGLFVKNLENVQGDERDVILFSTAFSVNERGVLPLNFGPLNRAGGERRLNVAVTRARRQVVVYSSFAPAQMRTEETSSIGVKHLRAYLELAERGPGDVTGPDSGVRTLDRHRRDVAEHLRDAGLLVEEGLGLSDFRVDLAITSPSSPARRLVAVVLDGPEWAGRRTVGDRDGLPAQVLGEMLRWPSVQRVWMPEWIRDPDAVVARLLDEVERALATPDAETSTAALTGSDSGPGGDTALRSPESPPEDDLDDRSSDIQAARTVAQDTKVAGLSAPARTDTSGPAAHGPADRGEDAETSAVQTLRPWDPQHRGGRAVLDQLFERQAQEKVRAVLAEITAAEGPVHLDRAVRLVAAAFGLTRVSQNRARAIITCIPSSWRPSSEPDILHDPTTPYTEWGGIRRDPEQIRGLEHTPLREIAHAMRHSCRVSAGMERIEMFRAALAVFGVSRLTPNADRRLAEALDVALSAGLVHEREGTFYAL